MMDGILQTTETFLREHQMWAGVTVGLVAFGESLFLSDFSFLRQRS